MGGFDYFRQAADILGLETCEFINRASIYGKRKRDDKVELCAIINIARHVCDMDCHFCGQNCYTSVSQKYPPMDTGVLRHKIAELADLPLAHIGLVSTGSRIGAREFDELLQALELIPPEIVSRLCVSIGHLDANRLARLKEYGIRRCHHNLETSAKHYPQICSTQTWQKRYETVVLAIEMGMEICSGALFGIGENWEDRIALGETLKNLGICQIPMNFLHPVQGTRMAGNPILDVNEALACIMLFRNILQDSTLRICGGRKKVFPGSESAIFDAGADALMTGDFLLTKGRQFEEDCCLLKKCGYEIRY